MAGTKEGGLIAAEVNKQKYGNDFYKKIGAIGGKKSKTGGFASNVIGPDGLTGRERARIFGNIYGKNTTPSKKITKSDLKARRARARRQYEATYAKLQKIHDRALKMRHRANLETPTHQQNDNVQKLSQRDDAVKKVYEPFLV